MALAVVALCPSTVKRLDPLNRNLLLWIIFRVAVIQLQVLSWWSYHYVLLFTPLGILAARGVDTLWTHARNQWIELSRLRIALSLAMAIGFLYSPVLYALGYNTFDVLRQGVPVTTKSQLRKIQISRDDSLYREMLEDVQFLNEPSSAPGSIYVCGPHRYYLLSGREPAIFLDGWALWFYFPEYERPLVDQPRKAQPSYIYVDKNYNDMIDKRLSAIGSLISNEYRVFRLSRSGVWFLISERVGTP